jgi:excisionase family DNA binding protein
MLLTVREVADRLRVSQATVYALCQRGILPHERHGTGRGCIRVSDEALAAYRASATRAGGPTSVPPAPAGRPKARLKHLKL